MPEKTRYLSDEWLTKADEQLAALSPISTAVSVAMTVTDGPDGERNYRLVLGPERVGVAPGVGDSGVSMTVTWPVAVAIATGEASAQRAFLDGNLQLGGDTSLLLGHQQQLADIADKLDGLRSTTDFGQ